MADLLAQGLAVQFEYRVYFMFWPDEIRLFINEPHSDVLRSRAVTILANQRLNLPNGRLGLAAADSSLEEVSDMDIAMSMPRQDEAWTMIREFGPVPAGEYEVEILSLILWKEENYEREVLHRLTKIDLVLPRFVSSFGYYLWMIFLLINIFWSLPHLFLISRFSLRNGMRFGGTVFLANAVVVATVAILAVLWRHIPFLNLHNLAERRFRNENPNMIVSLRSAVGGNDSSKNSTTT